MPIKADFKAHPLFKLNYDIPEGIDLTINRGGTSSGKTFTILLAINMVLYGDAGSLCSVIGQDMPNLKKGAIRDMETIRSKSNLINSLILKRNKTEQIYYFKNGSKIEFVSYDDEQDAKSGKRDYAFFNEINGIPFDVFEAIYVRTSKHTWVDFNPSGEFWLKTKGYEQRKGTQTIVSTFQHNPFLGHEIIEKIKGYEPTPENIANKTANEYRWKVYGLGEYAALEGAIFKNWTRGEFNNKLDNIFFGIDWGYTDPFAFVKVGIDHKNRKIYLKKLAYETELSMDQIVKYVKKSCSEDDLIIYDNSQPMNGKQLRDEDFNALPVVKPRIRERITWMQDYQFVVDPSSPEIENELNNYVWADDKSETPIDGFNHALDAVGYVYTWWRIHVHEPDNE